MHKREIENLLKLIAQEADFDEENDMSMELGQALCRIGAIAKDALKKLQNPQKDGRKIEITFSGSGTITSTIQLKPNCDLTAEQVQEMLNSCELVTTVQEGGTLEYTATGELVGTVVDVDNELEYTDFEVKEDA